MNNRNKFKDYLLTKGIETAIHYPTPIHLQPAAKRLGYKYGDFPITENQSERILTLPISQSIIQSDLKIIVDEINNLQN